MKVSSGLVVLIAISLCAGENASSKKKLQIGIKKRVDNCTLKSKKGDTLYVNYVVCWTGHPDPFKLVLLYSIVGFNTVNFISPVESSVLLSMQFFQLSLIFQGALEDGTEFDKNSPDDPFLVTLGYGQVIKGWEQGLIGLIFIQFNNSYALFINILSAWMFIVIWLMHIAIPSLFIPRLFEFLIEIWCESNLIQKLLFILETSGILFSKCIFFSIYLVHWTYAN